MMKVSCLFFESVVFVRVFFFSSYIWSNVEGLEGQQMATRVTLTNRIISLCVSFLSRVDELNKLACFQPYPVYGSS